ncbi:hypothetical protein GCM10023310_46110 [Paenibacillus vulneris]|uniref:DUF4384 domain-containing protein n=1 Tax=Paenibacillus vulneris TaxID=1133364 RepID=A0ABW3UG58_9BACL
MKKIQRTKTIEGTSIPGIIHNGGHYFYINVDIYEDGMTNCWELVDLKGLESKINSNWLTPVVPIGDTISIHGLGSYRIDEANWKFNKKSYYKHIKETIKVLNPEFVNIYEISNREKTLSETRRIVHSPRATDFYVENEMFYQTAEGNGFFIFMKYEGKHYLVNLIAYKNGLVVIYHLPNEVQYRVKEIGPLFENGTFFTTYDNPIPITLSDLGEVILSKPLYAANIEEKYKELMDIYKKLNGEKSSLEACREAYYSYLENPSEFYRENLRKKYELVPEHERRYLGDMDSKDSDYRRILYRPNVKREV